MMGGSVVASYQVPQLYVERIWDLEDRLYSSNSSVDC